MGKTPKKAAPGGDERNLYNRTLKATTATSNASETSSHKRQRESQISNRSKLTGLQKRIPRRSRKNFKSKIRAPTKFDLSCAVKHIGETSGDTKEAQVMVSEKSEEACSTTMQPELEETEEKLNPPVETEDTSKDVSDDNKELRAENVDRAPVEHIIPIQVEENPVNEKVAAEDGKTECEEKTSNLENSKETEEHEECELNLALEPEDNSAEIQVESTNANEPKVESTEKYVATAAEVKNGVPEKEDSFYETQTDTESYSADVLECTTSEVSETSEFALQNDVQKEKEKVEENMSKDASFVSYDPSIILKDVQIKLNDCLKENSKPYDASVTNYSSLRDMSYGKTLRSISGRRSLSRMRHVTIREHRYSPSDSMFVNTSSTSSVPDEVIDFKILRYSTGLPDTLSATNGSSTEKKRKRDINDWNSTKKSKTESENSVLNTSISLLKGLRRPIQVSTPVSELKFQSSKLDMDDGSKSEDEVNKKWCVIM